MLGCPILGDVNKQRTNNNQTLNQSKTTLVIYTLKLFHESHIIMHVHFGTDFMVYLSFCERRKPEAAVGHITFAVRKNEILARISHECADRTSQRAEIPPTERR